MEHPTFGKMDAVIDYGSEMYFWEMTKPVYTPIGRIEGAFDAGADGPSASQLAHWHEIISDYESFKPIFEPMLKQTLHEFDRVHEFGQLRPSTISFHDQPDVDVDWDLAFEHPISNSIYTVCFIGNQPTAVTVDD